MKKKMDQLLSGKFEYGVPQLLFSCEKVTVTLSAGEQSTGEFYIGTDENIRIRGFITSSSYRMAPEMTEFTGITIKVPFIVDAGGLAPGEQITGAFCFTTNIGEHRLPFEVNVKKDQIQNADGMVRNLEDFSRAAEKDFRDAFRMFISPAFSSVLEQETDHERNLYAGMSRQPVTYQHLEEFLIACGKKQPVHISLPTEKMEYFNLREDLEERFTILKDNWGHVRLELETQGGFIELSRKVVTEEDFVGSRLSLPFIIRKDALGNVSKYGKIIITSPYERREFLITASVNDGRSIQVVRDEKKNRALLMKDYIAYRTGGMDFKTWNAKAETMLKEMEESGYDYPEYHMYHAFILHLKEQDEEAKEILLRYMGKSFQKEDLELAGIYLYLCTLTGLYTEIDQAVARVKKFYRQKPDSFFLLYVLLRMDQDYRESPSKAIFMLEEQYEKGCNSPLLYLEAWKYLKSDQDFLRRLTPFWCHVFLFAGKRKLLTEELVNRMAYLSGYEKKFYIWMYRALAKGYEQYPSRDTLEAVCKYIIQGDPRRPEYFKWYELAVEQEIRLTRIYEYYIETMDASYKSTLPKQVLVYFSYNTNTLSDARRAFLYANIVSHKYGENSYYASYRDRIRHFAEKKLEEGRMDEYYAVLYQEFFEEPDTEDDATLIARKMFTNRLYCDDPKMREVIVRHPQLTEEEVYSLKKGIAYPRIYNEDAVLIFRDDKQRRYVSTVACNVQPLMDDFKMTEAVLDFDINEPGVLLHYCTREEINEDNLEIFQRLVEVEDFSIEYKNQIRKRIMDYFTAHVLEDQMDLGLKDLDFPAYAAVDKPQLLELLIQRGLYPEAMEIVKAFGAENANQTSILKLVSRMISRNEWVSDDQLFAIALKVYQDGKYDEVILRYLMDNCQGDLDVMLSIWNSAKGFDLDTLDMEEKILSLLMLTSDYRKEGEAVLESYVKQSGKERVIGAYLTQLSYACLVKEQSLAPFTRKCLEYAWKNQWPVNRICHMALLKLLAGEKDPAEKDIDMKKQILAECMEEDLQFAFYKKLPVKLLAPYQMDDKTFVELHASPDARVTLYYTLDNGLGKEEEYRSQPLKNQYEGIFVRAFTLFYGETLRYYFTVEENGKSRKTSEKTVSLNRAEGQNGSRYQMINRILAARKLDKDKEVTDNLKQYLRQEQYVADMFHLTEEE